MPSKLNLLNKVFGRLTVIREFGKDKQGFVLWECICECNSITIVRSASLNNGHICSCGCLKANNNKKHDKSRTIEYRTWSAMKARCNNPKNKKYHLYGGRGISVCDRWLHSFENFLSDIGLRPSIKHSIDRFPDKDGNYQPGNVRWATDRQQNINKNGNRVINFNGESKTCIEWSEQLGLKKSTFLGRLKMGWPLEKIMTEPVKKRRITY